MMRFAPVLVALTLMTAPAAAQEASLAVASDSKVDLAAQHTDTLIAGGEWTFTAPRGAPKGSPICTESWTFRVDGTMTVVSGTQVVENTWRVVSEDGFERLFTTSLSSTEGVDCMGERANPADYPRQEGGGAAILFFNGGNGGYLCTPVLMEMPDGTKMPMYNDEDCWGELRVAQPAVDIMVPANRIDPAAPPQNETTINR
jgi:hypothetical protein